MSRESDDRISQSMSKPFLQHIIILSGGVLLCIPFLRPLCIRDLCVDRPDVSFPTQMTVSYHTALFSVFLSVAIEPLSLTSAGFSIL